MIACEALIFAFGYMTTLGGLTYRKRSSLSIKIDCPVPDVQQGPDASVWAYLLTVIFPTDIFVGFLNAIRTLAQLPLGRKRYDLYWRYRHCMERSRGRRIVAVISLPASTTLEACDSISFVVLPPSLTSLARVPSKKSPRFTVEHVGYYRRAHVIARGRNGE